MPLLRQAWSHLKPIDCVSHTNYYIHSPQESCHSTDPNVQWKNLWYRNTYCSTKWEELVRVVQDKASNPIISSWVISLHSIPNVLTACSLDDGWFRVMYYHIITKATVLTCWNMHGLIVWKESIVDWGGCVSGDMVNVQWEFMINRIRTVSNNVVDLARNPNMPCNCGLYSNSSQYSAH